VLIKFCFPEIVLNAIGMGTPALGSNVSIGSGLVLEAVLTFFLMFVIYGTAVDKRIPQQARP